MEDDIIKKVFTESTTQDTTTLNFILKKILKIKFQDERFLKFENIKLSPNSEKYIIMPSGENHFKLISTQTYIVSYDISINSEEIIVTRYGTETYLKKSFKQTSKGYKESTKEYN